MSRQARVTWLVDTVPGAAAAVAHGIALPVRGLEAPSKPLSSRLTGLFTVVLVWIMISVYGSQIALGIGFFPPTAPIAMPVLYAAGDVPLWQVVIAAALLAVSTVWMARVAAGIYGRSILRTGARVKLREALSH